MKKTNYLFKTLICLLAIVTTSSYAQNKVSYGYDVNGNRKIRNTCPTCRLAHNPDNSSSADTSIQADTAIAIKHGANLFPNPTQNRVNLSLSNLKDDEATAVLVTDENGQTLYTQKNLQAQNQIDLSSFNNGTYFVRVTMGKDVLVYKVMKLQ